MKKINNLNNRIYTILSNNISGKEEFYKFSNNLGFFDKLSMKIANIIGTPVVFFIFIIWVFLWLLWNSLVPEHLIFDHPPEFKVWLFISNLIQLTLMPLLLVKQNKESEIMERVIDADYFLAKQTDEKLNIVLRCLQLNLIVLSYIMKQNNISIISDYDIDINELKDSFDKKNSENLE